MESFLRLIENDFNQYRRYIIKNKLFENIKIKISNIILYSPNPNNSFIQSFEDVYSYQSEDYTKILNELYIKLKIDKSSLWYTDEPINEKILGIIQDSLRQNKNVMYLHKHVLTAEDLLVIREKTMTILYLVLGVLRNE